ncbi:Uu.00g020500.m01.CDS01 [Anthostomella pinea]|uniref:Uu.00g020500.m01.CDS01 n=1 Tax=Anthostomella pinea TaxID=933095 RepID=A0AAI8VTN5_9PEZI|nr:Uu.00g020500.m01.CDS01 [Anthostomella pinea]
MKYPASSVLLAIGLTALTHAAPGKIMRKGTCHSSNYLVGDPPEIWGSSCGLNAIDKDRTLKSNFLDLVVRVIKGREYIPCDPHHHCQKSGDPCEVVYEEDTGLLVNCDL